MAQSYQVDIVTKVSGYQNVQKLEKALAGLANDQKKVDQAARQASGSVTRLGSASRSAGTAAKGSATGFKAMGTAIAAAAAKITVIVGAVQTFTRVLSTAFERGQAEQRLKNLTGSTEEYEAALLAAQAASKKFGVTQTEATQSLTDVYSRLKGLGYGLKEVTEIYDGFNTVAREAGVSSQDAALAFTQLGQALGSGRLNGDELARILESFPQLAQAIAKEMGVSAGALRQLGAEGKITGQEIYDALQKAGGSAGDLTGKLSPADAAFREFQVAIDNAAVTLGESLLPAITKLIQAITPAIEFVGNLIKKLDELGANKVLEFLFEPARIFGELISDANEQMGQTKISTEELGQAAKEAVSEFSSLPQKVENTKDAAKLLKQEQQQSLQLAKAQAQQATANSNAAIAAAEREVQAATTIEQKQRAIAELVELKQQAIEQAYQSEAKVLNEQLKQGKITKEIYETKVQTLNTTKQQATAEAQAASSAEQVASATQQAGVSSGNLADNAAKTAQGLQAAVPAAQQLGHASHQQAIDAQRLHKFNQGNKKELAFQAEYAAQINEMQMHIIQDKLKLHDLDEATTEALKYQLAIIKDQDVQLGMNAARASDNADQHYEVSELLSRNKNKIEEMTAGLWGSTQAAGGLANELGRAADNAARIAAASGIGAKGSYSTQSGHYTNYIPAGAISGSNVGSRNFQQDLASGVAKINHPRFGKVTYDQYKYLADNPDKGLKHYRADQAASREEQKKIQYEISHGPGSYEGSQSRSGVSRSLGGSGSAAAVNVNYSGSTLTFNGDDYVSKGDVNGIVNQAVGKTMNTLSTSSGARLRAGLR